jgi:4-nitrophenyl phosphatase
LEGAGSIISALETCSGRTPIVTGKPSLWFVEFVRKLVGNVPEKCLMIGDRLDTDVAFGLLAGFKTMLVTETG